MEPILKQKSQKKNQKKQTNNTNCLP